MLGQITRPILNRIIDWTLIFPNFIIGFVMIAGCVLELEQFYEEMDNPTIDFIDGFTRTVVGRMIKSILKPFGYQVEKQKDFPKNRKEKYFISASCYKLATSEATMRIVKRIEEIET